MDVKLPFNVVDLRFDYPWRKGFSFSFFLVVLLFVLFCFVLFVCVCFFFNISFFDRLKYTDRLIASPLPAFMSKIINPQVSNIGTL